MGRNRILARCAKSPYAGLMASTASASAGVDVTHNPANVVARAAAVLEAVARASAEGARLVDLANATGIARPSVHRLLQDLTEVGYIEQGADRLYRLGSGLFMLGLNAPTPGWDLTAIRPIAAALAEVSEDTVYVAVRQFDAAVGLPRASINCETLRNVRRGISPASRSAPCARCISTNQRTGYCWGVAPSNEIPIPRRRMAVVCDPKIRISSTV